MAGFPEAGRTTEIGCSWRIAGPGSLFPFLIQPKGPGRNKEERH
jgi:hypothetical protein